MRSLGYNEQALRLCIDGVAGDKVWGRVYSMRLSRPVAFSDLSDFIMKMDEVMDAQNFPQSFQRKRAFKGAATGRQPDHVRAATEGEPLGEAEVEAAAGEKATLVVRVLTRQNASWQGHVVVPGQPGVREFESELGFMQIVADCLGG